MTPRAVLIRVTFLLFAGLAAPAHAQEAPEPDVPVVEEEREAPTKTSREKKKTRRKLRIRIPLFIVRKERRIALQERAEREARAKRAAHEALARREAALTEAEPAGGIWEWVSQMGGEVPSAEQLAAIREARAAHATELELIDGLAGRLPPTEFYRDPAAALATHPLYLDLVDPDDFDIPIEINAWTEKWVRYFAEGKGRTWFARWLVRAGRYQPMMKRELKKAGLPLDLVYLSMIESGYNPHAYSSAGAAGLWQFITSTGRSEGLRIDWWVDERRDPEASLAAAIHYLATLHRQFGDWRLAWAAYNGGPSRVNRAATRAGSRDFWRLADGPYLPSETDNYVPKIMAAAIVAKHADRYGFDDIPEEPALVYDVIRIEGAVELRVLASAARTSLSRLQALNPALRRFATPPEGYPLRVPPGSASRVRSALAELPDGGRLRMVQHTVRRGDSLSKVAKRYDTSVEAIRGANDIDDENHIPVGLVIVVPARWSHEAAVEAPAADPSAPPAPAVHVVKRGESLSLVARRYGLRVSDLVAWNGLRDASHIEVGQTLRLRPSSGDTPTTPAPAAPAEPAEPVLTHVVQRGQTLSAIAERYGVRVSELQAWNGIRNPSLIVVGQELVVRKGRTEGASSTSSRVSWVEHKVRRGDSLGEIAESYGVSVGDLKHWNGLRTSTIYVGQVLRIRR